MGAGVASPNPTTPLSLALRFSAFTMRKIGLGIAPLDPRHKSEALFNRICMQGQHDLEEPAQLRHRECWRFFPPDALARAREKNGPASCATCGVASRHLAALHSAPSRVPFALP